MSEPGLEDAEREWKAKFCLGRMIECMFIKMDVKRFEKVFKIAEVFPHATV